MPHNIIFRKKRTLEQTLRMQSAVIIAQYLKQTVLIKNSERFRITYPVHFRILIYRGNDY
jgi:hypothetical protein